jgi:hypothetical protein
MPVSSPLAKLIIQGILSLGLLGAGLFVLVTMDLKANPELAVSAGGWIALPVGYWMK